MGKYTESYFLSSNGKTDIHLNKWEAEDSRAVVIISHGVAEYGARYKDFASFLNENGITVYASDHLGHGKSIIKGAKRLYFGKEKGWDYVTGDIEKVRERAQRENPDKPVFIFGHSMGSFILRTYLIRYRGRIKGAIICGTAWPGKLTIKAGKLLADNRIKALGKEGFSPLSDKLAFGAYNKKFAPNRTESDWLSANIENVDAFINDPLCGGKTSLGLFRDMLDGLTLITDRGKISLMDKNMPVLLIAGEDDPVGDMGKGVKKTYKAFTDEGLKNVKMKLYPHLRHEILNEKEHMEVYEDILHFLNENI